jgi:hypothetical protein
MNARQTALAVARRTTVAMTQNRGVVIDPGDQLQAEPLGFPS